MIQTFGCYLQVTYAINMKPFLPVRGSRPGKSVQMTEAEVRGL